MSIKSSVYNNNSINSTGNYDGCVSYAEGIVVPNENFVAKRPLDFMLVSFPVHWKYPVRYVLNEKVNPDDLNCLLSWFLDLCAWNNITVRCITKDGTLVNLISIKLFGGKLKHSLGKINGGFTYDGNNYKFYFIPDLPPTLKLACNALGKLEIFLDRKCRKIAWTFITLLHEKQTQSGIKFSNSLSGKHIHYFGNKMNVKFAAQTVADLSEFIMYPAHPSFQNAEATAHFIRTIDRLFNILNVKNLYDKGFKQSLKLCYQIIWSELIVNVIEYLLTLKTIDDTPLILHRR